MSNERSSAEFGVLTDEQQGAVVGGDGGILNALGWFVGYAVGCTQQALLVDFQIAIKQPVIYIPGKGFI